MKLDQEDLILLGLGALVGSLLLDWLRGRRPGPPAGSVAPGASQEVEKAEIAKGFAERRRWTRAQRIAAALAAALRRRKGAG